MCCTAVNPTVRRDKRGFLPSPLSSSLSLFLPVGAVVEEGVTTTTVCLEEVEETADKERGVKMVREYNMEQGVEDLEDLEVPEVAEEDAMDEQEERNSENDANNVSFNIPQYNQQNQHNQQFAPFPRSVSRVAYDLIVGGAPEDAMVDLVDLVVMPDATGEDVMDESEDGNDDGGSGSDVVMKDVVEPEKRNSANNGGEGEGSFGHANYVPPNIRQYHQHNQHLVPSQKVFQESRRL